MANAYKILTGLERQAYGIDDSRGIDETVDRIEINLVRANG